MIAIGMRGRRLFSTAALLMILTAAAHTVGNFSVGPGPAEQQKVFAGMSALHFPMGMRMNPSLEDVYWDLVFTMSITLGALGLINLVLAASSDIPDSVLQRVGWLNLVWVGAFLALSWHYRIPPPLISAIVIEVFVLAALVMPKVRRSPRP